VEKGSDVHFKKWIPRLQTGSSLFTTLVDDCGLNTFTAAEINREIKYRRNTPKLLMVHPA
jgi:hypothetical protein